MHVHTTHFLLYNIFITSLNTKRDRNHEGLFFNKTPNVSFQKQLSSQSSMRWTSLVLYETRFTLLLLLIIIPIRRLCIIIIIIITDHLPSFLPSHSFRQFDITLAAYFNIPTKFPSLAS